MNNAAHISEARQIEARRRFTDVVYRTRRSMPPRTRIEVTARLPYVSACTWLRLADCAHCGSLGCPKTGPEGSCNRAHGPFSEKSRQAQCSRECQAVEQLHGMYNRLMILFMPWRCISLGAPRRFSAPGLTENNATVPPQEDAKANEGGQIGCEYCQEARLYTERGPQMLFEDIDNLPCHC